MFKDVPLSAIDYWNYLRSRPDCFWHKYCRDICSMQLLSFKRTTRLSELLNFRSRHIDAMEILAIEGNYVLRL